MGIPDPGTIRHAKGACDISRSLASTRAFLAGRWPDAPKAEMIDFKAKLAPDGIGQQPCLIIPPFAQAGGMKRHRNEQRLPHLRQ